jgi:hypothetical protein
MTDTTTTSAPPAVHRAAATTSTVVPYLIGAGVAVDELGRWFR